MLNNIKLYIIIYFLHTLSCYALISDNKKAIEINANFAKFDQKNRIYTFYGNVVVNRGSINIYANEGIVSQIDEKNKKINLEGTPIKFSQQQDNNELVKGECNKFFYDTKTNDAILIGNAKISKGKINISGHSIKYNTKTELYSINSINPNNINNKSNDRVTIILDDIDNATKSIK